MKKHILLLVALTILAQMIWAANVEPNTSLTTYYAAADGKSSNSNDDLRKTLCSIISANYTSIGYSSLQNSMFAASSNPTDFVNGSDKTMEDIYSSKPYKNSDNGSSATNCGTGWNKEHTVPQSWFNESSPMKSDAFHVYPTDIKMNSVRSSYPYGENDAEKSCTNYGYGSLGTSTFPGYTGTVFDPGEGGEYGSYKGDLARTYFYMVTRYRTTNFTSGTGNTSFTYSGNVADLTDYMKNLMLKWHREDPVSEKELKRNNAIYMHQKNRNPFIDYPELVEYIWGTKKGQTVSISTLVSAYDGETPPVPPTPVVKYGVTWSVNGEELQTDSIAKDQNVSALPATPQSCSSESTLFMGWTDAPIDGALSDAPSPLYTAVEQIPAITADITLYAVFAQLSSSDVSLPTSYTYAVGNTDDSWTNTATLTNNSYWLLETGKTITSPAIDLMGLEKITVKIRTYGGTSNNKLDISTSDGALTSITTDKGTTLTEFTWTNNLYIAGISPLTFSSNYGSGKGIGISSITIDASGTGATYSRYITNCQSGSEVVNILTDAPAKKVLIGNQIYIFVGEQLFTIQGLQVK